MLKRIYNLPYDQTEYQIKDRLSFMRFPGVGLNDKVVAKYALLYGDDMKIVISSFDSDFFQLITENVSVLRYRGDKTVICYTEYIQNKFGILPSQYVDFKSMTGDNSDNIKGADKVGIKTAAMLVNLFGSLENIIEGAEAIEKPSVRESIIRNKERLKINYKLIRLTDKANIPFYINELAWQDNGAVTNDVLRGIGLK